MVFPGDRAVNSTFSWLSAVARTVAPIETVITKAFAACECFAFFRLKLSELLAIMEFMDIIAIPTS